MPGNQQPGAAGVVLDWILVFAAVILLIIGPSWGVNPASAGQQEIGARTEGTTIQNWDQPLDYELEIGFNWLLLLDDDLYDTYGSVPEVQARLSLQVARQVRFFLGAGYGRSGGDPYYDEESFSWDRDGRLEIVPIQMGVRTNLSSRRDFRLNLSFLIEGCWVRETLPPPYYGYPDDSWQGSGWCLGLGVSFGPEWRFGDQGWAFGYEGCLTGSGGSVGRDIDHDVNLSSMSWRAYLSKRI